MKLTRIIVLLSVASLGLLAAPDDDARLIPMPAGLTVYDTVLKVRWLANANLPGTAEGRFGIAGITPNGSMDYATATEWLTALNGLNGGVGYLSHNDWTLPTTPTFPALDPTCKATGPHGNSFGFGCTGSDMGSLFYVSLGLQYPNTAVPIPDNTVGPFSHVQPYLYWSCSAPVTNPPCQNPPPSPGFQWSFSFGNGFQGTDVHHNDLYVMVYFPQAPAQALSDAIQDALATSPELNAFLSQAAEISAAPDAQAKAGKLTAFINHVNAQRGKALTAAQADELAALAQAI